jgi:sRNA-binding regulator protein Hfq
MSSTLYTMGTALRRAQDSQVDVALLVEGQWMQGRVAAVDGHGIILDTNGVEHSVVRLERVSAVRVLAPAPEPEQEMDSVGIIAPTVVAPRQPEHEQLGATARV